MSGIWLVIRLPNARLDSKLSLECGDQAPLSGIRRDCTQVSAHLNHLLPITIVSQDGAGDSSVKISGNVGLAINPCPAKRRRVDALHNVVRAGISGVTKMPSWGSAFPEMTSLIRDISVVNRPLFWLFHLCLQEGKQDDLHVMLK
jgi:hypothetical protein